MNLVMDAVSSSVGDRGQSRTGLRGTFWRTRPLASPMRTSFWGRVIGAGDDDVSAVDGPVEGVEL